MKDKELRELLLSAGVIQNRMYTHSMSFYLASNNVSEKLENLNEQMNALLEHFDIEFKRDEPKLRVVKRTSKKEPGDG